MLDMVMGNFDYIIGRHSHKNSSSLKCRMTAWSQDILSAKIFAYEVVNLARPYKQYFMMLFYKI